MPDICQYTDYRKFLKDHYEETKRKTPGFSYQVYSQKAGLKSKGFLHNVVCGKRSLPTSAILALSQTMRLDRYEVDYFENLVAFNEAVTLDERNHYYGKLSTIKANGTKAWKSQLVRREQFEFYSRLHHSAIRSLIGCFGFDGDYAKLAGMLRPRISAKQARKSVELLEKLGFIRKKNGGPGYEIVDATITTPPEVEGLAVQNFHRESGELAISALAELPRSERNITSVMLGISRETYAKVCSEIEAFRSRLLRIAEADPDADCVYQVNFQCFPVSKIEAPPGEACQVMSGNSNPEERGRK